MPRPLCVPCLAAVLALAAGAAAGHDNPPRYDQVHLSASAGAEVDTDLLVAVLFREEQSDVQATAADEVNRAVRWAIDQAKAAGVSVETSAYRTQPVYQKQQIRGWRVHQSIRLESRDPDKLAALLGELQQRLSIQSLGNELSPQARKAAEDALIGAAVDAFQARAALIATTLKRDGHRIVSLDVSTSGAAPPPGIVMRATAMESAAPPAPPAVEPGTLTVEVHVSGTVELNAPRRK